jgi:single-strand DNA-binding protein
MNRVSLIGRITRDPEVRYSQNGSAFLMFTIAVNRNQRDANGQTVADFISVTAFGQQAEFIGRYVKKGYLLAIAGRIQTRNYQGQDGQTHYVTEVVAEQVENLTPRDQNAAPANYQNNQPRQQGGYNNPSYGAQNNGYSNPSYQRQEQPANEAPESFNVQVADDDLPF